MQLEARGIILDKLVESAEALNHALLPEIRLLDFEVRRSLLKGIQSFRETPFDVCFVSDSFPLEELKSFFADVKLLQREATCVFIQVRDTLGEGVTRSSLEGAGFSSIITRKVSDGDKAAIADVLTELLKKQEIKRKRLDVETAVKLLMLEIDRVSKDRRRGNKREFTRNIVSGFLTDQLDFHSDILDGYFKALENYSDLGEPHKDLVVELPQDLIDLNLPGVKDGEYVGTSLRVYDMLRDKFGREIDAPSVPPAVAQQSQDEEEEVTEDEIAKE